MMITLRSYPNSIDATLAQSHLQAAGIDCELADESSNANTVAQFAVPVRLLVDEERVAEATAILNEQSTGLPEQS